MSTLRSQVGEQNSDVLLGDQWLHCIIAYHSSSYQEIPFDRFFEPLKVPFLWTTSLTPAEMTSCGFPGPALWSMLPENFGDHFNWCQKCIGRGWNATLRAALLVFRLSHTVQYGGSKRLVGHGVCEMHVRFETPVGQFHRCGGGI